MSPFSRQNTVVLAVSAIAIAGVPAGTAQACSPLLCAPSVFLPVSGHVPSNAVEFLWQPPWTGSGLDPDSYSVHLYQLENGQRREIESELIAAVDGLRRVRPKQPVAEGSVLMLEAEEPTCAVAAVTAAMVTVGAPTPAPTQLGKLQTGETHDSTIMNLPTNRGSCRADFAVASVQIKLTLDPAAQPFLDSMRHALVVDGVKRKQPAEPPPIRNWYPLGGELENVLYTLCKDPSDSWTADVPAGTHRVQWLATLPDGSELRSDEISIELQCRSADDAAPKPMQPAAESDTATTAAASTERESDGESAADERSADETSADESRATESCALTAPPGARKNDAWAVGLALLLLCWRRARSRGRPTPSLLLPAAATNPRRCRAGSSRRASWRRPD
jgi:hypothetical protein